MNKVDVTVLSTLYNSARFVKEFHSRSTEAIESQGLSVQHVFVDDGSPDNSSELVGELIADGKAVTLVELSRNFGHHRAILAGMPYCDSPFTFLIDSDLEEDPENFKKFLAVLKRDPGIDVAFGVQQQRSRRRLYDLFGRAYYRMFSYLAGTPITANQVMSRVMRERFVSAMMSYKEAHPVMVGIWSDMGFKQQPVEIQKHFKGSTSYTLRRLLSQTVDTVTGFSAKPLYYLFYAGSTIAVMAAFIAFGIVVQKLRGVFEPSGWASLIVSVWFLGGSILAGLGLVGIYLGRIYVEVKGRPRTIVRRVISSVKDDDGAAN